LTHDYIFGDVFDWLKRFARSKQKFDLVILDPPSFSTTKHSRFSVEQNYSDLISLAASVTSPSGHILACANTAEISVRSFKTKLQAGLVNHSARIISTAHEPEIDFPVAIGNEPYLKVCLVKMMS
jgi:23S rRNA (cytosine1962-C5)-methyltransferase